MPEQEYIDEEFPEMEDPTSQIDRIKRNMKMSHAATIDTARNRTPTAEERAAWDALRQTGVDYPADLDIKMPGKNYMGE